MKKNQTLKILNLSENNISNECFPYILDYFSTNKSLKKLNLSSNNLNNDSAKFLLQILVNNLYLEILDLSKNNLGIEGFELVCNSLQFNSVITSLDISQNKISVLENKENQNFLNFLLKNKSLKNLFFELNFFDPVLQSKLEYIICCNNRWTPSSYLPFHQRFFECVFSFFLCIKKIQKKINFKIPKFVLYEIVQRIDRKSFFHLTIFH